MKVFAIALVILGFATSSAAQSAIQYDSPELTSGKVHIKRVVLTPVSALVSQLNWKSGVYDPGTPMEAESQKLEKDLNPIVAATLKSMGFTVDDAFLSPESLAGNKDLGDKVKLVLAAFAMQKGEIESHKKRYATEPVS